MKIIFLSILLFVPNLSIAMLNETDSDDSSIFFKERDEPESFPSFLYAEHQTENIPRGSWFSRISQKVKNFSAVREEDDVRMFSWPVRYKRLLTKAYSKDLMVSLGYGFLTGLQILVPRIGYIVKSASFTRICNSLLSDCSYQNETIHTYDGNSLFFPGNPCVSNGAWVLMMTSAGLTLYYAGKSFRVWRKIKSMDDEIPLLEGL